MGVILPMEAPILEGPRGKISYLSYPDLVDSESWPNWATTRPAVPTLPSRAHLQDYGRRTTPSNYTQKKRAKIKTTTGAHPLAE